MDDYQPLNSVKCVKTPTLDQIIHGETEDETWNAAQKQYLLEAWMPNNLRMYWGKRLVGWRDSPQEAWRTACYLNDRFSLDGRDAATYGNLGVVLRKIKSSVRRKRNLRQSRATVGCGYAEAQRRSRVARRIIETENLPRFRSRDDLRQFFQSLNCFDLEEISRSDCFFKELFYFAF